MLNLRKKRTDKDSDLLSELRNLECSLYKASEDYRNIKFQWGLVYPGADVIRSEQAELKRYYTPLVNKLDKFRLRTNTLVHKLAEALNDGRCVHSVTLDIGSFIREIAKASQIKNKRLQLPNYVLNGAERVEVYAKIL